MTTGWKYIASNGQIFKSKMNAAIAYSNDNSLTFTFSELDMRGTKVTDVTDDIVALYDGFLKGRNF